MSDAINPRTGTPLGRANNRDSILDPSKPNTTKRESTRPEGKRKP